MRTSQPGETPTRQHLAGLLQDMLDHISDNSRPALRSSAWSCITAADSVQDTESDELADAQLGNDISSLCTEYLNFMDEFVPKVENAVERLQK